MKGSSLRTIKWATRPSQSRFYNNFPEMVTSMMEEVPSALHFHKYGVSTSSFSKYPSLANEFIITQKDTIDDVKHGDVEYICAMEHKRLPIFAIMYHPEY